MAIAMVSKENASPKNRKRKDGSVIPGLDYIRATEHGEIDPQGFTAVVDSNDSLGAHFHDVDQFQIMFGAPGSLYQRTPVPEVMVHYADAFVTYGPLIAGEQPLTYFTLRARPSTGMWFMPKDRESLKYRGRRHFEVFPEPFNASAPLAEGEMKTDVVIEDTADGLEARIITGGPGAVITVDPSQSPNGQYIVVVNGSVQLDGTSYGKESLGWQDQSDGPSEFLAGPEGCRVVVVRFPSPATTFGRLELATEEGAEKVRVPAL